MRRFAFMAGAVLPSSGFLVGCGEAGGGWGAGDGSFPVAGYQWGKRLNSPFPKGVDVMGNEETILTEPGDGPVEHVNFLCSDVHAIALDGVMDMLTDPGEITQYDNLVAAVEVNVEQACEDAAAARNLTLLPSSSTPNINCEEAADQNDFEFMATNETKFEESDCPGDGGDIDDEGFGTRAAGPANYGLTTFADVISCSSTAPECDVDEDFVDDLIDDMQPLVDDDQNLTIDSNGFHTGLMVINLNSASLMTYLGFQEDDTIVEVNDLPTTTWAEAWEAVATNLHAERLEVVYYRGRVKKTLDIDQVNLTTYP